MDQENIEEMLDETEEIDRTEEILVTSGERYEQPYEPFIHNQSDFDAFVWGRPENPAKTFSESLKDSKEESFVFKTFYNEFETDNLFGRKTIEMIKKGDLKLDNLNDLETKLPNTQASDLFFLPVNSSLKRNEMRECYKAYEDICSNKKLNGEKLEIYSKFKKLIEEEQASYLLLAHDYWLRNKFSEKVSIIKPEVLNYTSSLWKERLQRLHWYPKFYRKIADVSLMDDSERTSTCTFSKNLRTIGHSLCMCDPSWKKINQSNIYEKLLDVELKRESNVEFSYKPINTTLINKGYHPDVSRDELSESLCSRNNIQVVLSSSAFMCLFDIHKDIFNSSWELPVTIKSLSGSQKKVVFIDKVLPPKQLSAAQRNKWYSKKKILDLIKDTIFDKNRKTEDPFSYDECQKYDITKLETFGIQSSCDTVKTKKKMKRNNPDIALQTFSSDLSNLSSDECELSDGSRSHCSTSSYDMKNQTESNSKMDEDDGSASDSENELFIDVGEDKILKSDEEAPKIDSKPTELGNQFELKSKMSDCLQSILVKKEDALGSKTSELPDVSVNQETKKKMFVNNSSIQVDYNHFIFECESSSVLLKTNLKNLNVIIRSKCETKTKNKGAYINRVLSVKLEYQHQFGAEVLSLNEITRDWARVFIRPNSILLRVRLDPVTGAILMVERKNLQGLTEEIKRLYGRNPYDRLTSIHWILHQLTTHPPGKYIFSYDAKNGLFATLNKEDDKNNNFNLMIDYVTCEPNSVAPSHHNYLEIDKMIITPMQEMSKRIPATFHPKMSKFSSRLVKFATEEDNSTVVEKMNKTGKRKKARKKKSKNTKAV